MNQEETNLNPQKGEASPNHLDPLSPAPTPADKKPIKKWIYIIITLIIAVSGWIGYKSIISQPGGPRINVLSLVPADAIYILETDQPYNLWNGLSQTNIWTTLNDDKDWKGLGENLVELQNTLSDFDQVLDIIANRSTYVSGHRFRSDQLDHLFIVDLDGLSVVKSWLLGQENVTQRNYNGSIIYERLDLETRESLYFAIHDNYLVSSFTHTLVESSLDALADSELVRSFDFIDIQRKVIGEGLARIYINYNALYDHLQVQLGTTESKAMREQLPLIFSGMYFDIERDVLLVQGYSNFYDSISSYLNLFPKSGAGGLDIARVLPTNTSIYLSIGFDGFDRFYEALNEQFSADPTSGDDYKSYTKRTEKFLNIDIKKDLNKWIDDEFAIVQVNNSGDFETAMIIKAQDPKSARSGMDFLSKQVKRKTPVRFKRVEYKGYTINFMAVKGFFNLVLGGLFKNYDRPYYTIVDDFVIFSNKPQVLRMMIDQYVDGESLAAQREFQEFLDEAGRKHSALLYIQPSLLGEGKGGLLDNEYMEFLQSKSSVLGRFPQIAFKIVPDKKLYETKFLISVKSVEFDPKAILAPSSDSLEIFYDSLWAVDPGEEIAIEEIEIEDLGAKKQSELNDEGDPKYEVGLKDGLKHGNYFEYHTSGELKIKGKYKNDLREGNWKYYDTLGRLVKREKYKRDSLISSTNN